MSKASFHRRLGFRKAVAVSGAAAFVGALGLASPAAASDPGILQDHVVVIDAFAFAPANLEVAVGQSVEWVNQQAGVSHTVTHDPSGVGSPVLATGDTWEVLFTAPVADPIEYFCSIHPTMRGTITVTG